MSKRVVVLVLLAVMSGAVLIRYEMVTAGFFLNITGFVKQLYSQKLDDTKEYINQHFYQQERIASLEKENRELREKNEVLETFAKEVVKLSDLKGYSGEIDYKVKTVRAIAYAALPDMQKIIIDYAELEPNEVKGLVFNNQTAGIVVEKSGSKHSKALLNGDTKCSYAVYIGKEQAPGIVMGKSDEEMIVRYIPAWMNIEEGDEVVTSGLDGIFYRGVKVGKITKVHRLNAYTEATIKPYYNSFNLGYFYLVETAK